MPSMDEALRAVSGMIAEQLGETEDKPIETIYAALQTLGVMRVQKLFDEAMQLYSNGGMEVDGRPRTVGGVFFRHIKDSIEPAELRRFRKIRMALTAERKARMDQAA